MSLGSAPGIMVGIGVGTAAAAAIEPIVEPGRQQAWSNASNRILDPGLYARLVAQGALDIDVAKPLAKREGFNADQFNRLVYLAQEAPDLALTLELWRRGRFGKPDPAKPPIQVTHALAKAQIEAQYWPAITDLFNDRLAPPVIALAIVRGIMKDPGYLPVGPPATEGKVPAFPVSKLDTLDELQAHGYDFDRGFVETAIAGRPAPPNEAARAMFRGIIEPVDFDRAIAEGDIRNEWSFVLREVAREILTAGQYAELQLRGFLTADERRAETDKHGMSHPDSDLLYNLLGRSIPEHQITTGEARGGVFEGPIDKIPKAYLQSLQRGNLRPEYYNLAYANRYSMPSAFVLRSLATSGEITQAEAEQILLEIGWPPSLAKTVAANWAPAAALAKLNPWVKAQQTRLVTAMHKAVVKTGVPRTSLEQYLTPLVPDLADRDAIFQLWADERAVDGLAGV